MTRIGAITVGQAPRVDVTVDVLPIWGDKAELIEAGALDNLFLPHELASSNPITRKDPPIKRVFFVHVISAVLRSWQTDPEEGKYIPCRPRFEQ